MRAHTPYNPSAAPGALPAVPVATAAGAAAVGDPTGSGRVVYGTGLQPRYLGDGGQTSQLQQPQSSDAPILVDLPPDSLYVSRQLYGGAVSFPAVNQFKPRPPLLGGFQVMTRPFPASSLEGEAMEAQAYTQPATWRDAPPVVDLCRRTPADVGTGA